MKKIVPTNAVLIPEKAKKVFQGEIFAVYQWPQEMFDGTEETFEMLRRPDTVATLAIVGDTIIVIDDEQPNTGVRQSLPTGRADAADSDTLAAAKREMREETGYEFENWRLVNVIQPHSKIEWFVYFYVAWNGRKISEPKLDSGEKISVSLLSFEDSKALVEKKAGYMGEARELFDKAHAVDELKRLPEFQGRQIER